MDDEDRGREKAIRERLGAATPAPWQVIQSDIRLLYIKGPGTDGADGYQGGLVLSNCYQSDHVGLQPGNAYFIANAPLDVGWLLGRLESLRRFSTEWRASSSPKVQQLLDELDEELDRVGQ